MEKNRLMFLKRIELISPIDKLTQLDIEITKPLLCLVGDNGIGKSTILDALREELKIEDQSYLKRRDLKKHFKFTWNNPPSNPLAHDTHADNKKFAGSFGEDVGAHVASMKMSSGEGSLLFLSRVLKKNPDLLILDELDRGLSVKNQLILGISLLIKIKNNVLPQLIVSCHSHSIIDLWEKSGDDILQIFDVEANKTVTWDEYYFTQLQKVNKFFGLNP